MPNEQRIRQIVQEELQRSNNSSRFQLNTIPNHIHNGKDSPKIKAEDIIPSASVLGTIEMATEGRVYTLNLNSSFTPKLITAHGIITGTYAGSAVRAITVGTAHLTPSFYFQDNDSDASVITGDIQYPFPTNMPNGTTPTVPAQSSSYLLVSRGTVANTFALTSEDHIVSISGFPSASDIYARATVIGYSKDAIKIYVPYLDSGWTIFLTVIVS